MGMYGGSTKSLLCVCIFQAPTIRGKSLSGDLVLYVQALQNPIGVSFSAAQFSLDVLNRPVAVASCHQHKRLFSELTALLWGHVRAGSSFHALQPHLNVLVRLLPIKPPDPPNITSGTDRKWLPMECDDMKELIGHRQTAPKPTVPIKPEELITLLNGLESDPSLRLAVGLVALFGLRPAELMVLSVDDGNLKIGNVKRNAHSSATPKPPRTVQELPLKELQGEGVRLVQLFHSGLVKLPKSIRNLEAGEFKACGHTFRQYLDRNATWQSLKASNPELTPYSLRHGYAWRAAKYYPQPLPLRDTAKLMGHDLKTHIRHYGQWTDDASTKSAVEASIQSLVGAS